MERKHKLKEAWGNGMRPDVWEVFRTRFNIPIIHELYAATDGMGATFNPNHGEFSQNAIGVRGLLWHRWNGGNEIRAKIDPDTEEILRDEDGRVVKADVNEPGEVLHRVDPSVRKGAFLGYFKNEHASEKRWMYDVFEKGDLWFRSGDVMRVDSDGRVFFVDRLGDTFRWKSENVSTNEVSDVMGTFNQIAECNVYGVQVPNADGRCGAAAIVPQPPVTAHTIDMKALTQHVRANLPRYAVPLFLRIANQLSYTGTFKIQKGQAKREGADIYLIEQAGSNDKLFWLPPGGDSYVPYRKEDWQAIKSGKIML
jgi:acyl-CoA synthetase (AMP-forming)/AMP-acid ligase II